MIDGFLHADGKKILDGRGRDFTKRLGAGKLAAAGGVYVAVRGNML